ncbi:MAG: carboxymuconolactone decarboxylase family protein, partial [Planctomycetota bacterium]
MEITVHDPATAPEGSRETLNQVESAFGFIPNLMKVFAGAPPLLQAYLAASELFGQTSLDPTERQ